MRNDVIFICHGNVNRSRVAEEIIRSLMPDVNVESFAVGVKSKTGKLMTKKMRGVCDSNNIPYDISVRSKVLTQDDVINSDRVFVMDNNNIKHYKERFGDKNIDSVKLLPNLIGLDKIKDPGFSKGVSEYEESFNLIYKCCEKIVDELQCK